MVPYNRSAVRAFVTAVGTTIALMDVSTRADPPISKRFMVDFGSLFEGEYVDLGVAPLLTVEQRQVLVELREELFASISKLSPD